VRREWAVSMATVVVLLLGCRSREPEPPGPLPVVATCAEALGEVQVRRLGELYWEPVATGSTFHRGDWVRTGALASARLEFLAGGSLSLGEHSTVVVEPGNPADGGTEVGLVAVRSGEVSGTVDPGAGFPLAFETATGNRLRIDSEQASGRLTFLVVGTSEGTQVSVQEGVATLRLGEEPEVRIPAGQSAEVSSRVQLVESLPLPLLTSPTQDAMDACGANESVELSWTSVSDATAFRIQIARDEGFRSLEASERLITNTYSFAPGRAGHFAWRVAAYDAHGRTSGFTQPRRLQCLDHALRDLLAAPESGRVVVTTAKQASVDFAWRPAAEGARYRLIVARSQSLTRHVVVERTVEFPEQAVTLPTGEYFWGVYLEGQVPIPLFLAPRPLTVRWAPAPSLRTPPQIDEWGG